MVPLNPFPVYHFEGEVNVPPGQAFVQEYIQFPFEVPQGVGAVRCRLQYVPLRVENTNNLVTLGLFDPHGFRGNAHRHPPDNEILISPGHAAPGFRPGAIPAGRWLAQLAIHAVMNDEHPCRYSLQVEMQPFTGEQEILNPSWRMDAIAPGPCGWLRGELHSHTQHSDGSYTTSELLRQAKEKQLDFLAITDHNTVTALGEIQINELGSLVVIPGIELTTFYGHALVLGTDQWVDWRTGYEGWSMADAARQAHDLGGLFIVAHPNDIGSPTCTGCHWEYDSFDMDQADGLEIWNGWWPGWYESNARTLASWREVHVRGGRKLATCGSDFHHPVDWGPGRPLLYAHVEQRSVGGVLDALRKGRVVLSNGSWLEIRLYDEIQRVGAGIGDTLLTKTSPVVLSVDWSNAPIGARLVVYHQDGPVLDMILDYAQGTVREQVKADRKDCYWAELYAVDGELKAFTNPVFFYWKAE